MVFLEERRCADEVEEREEGEERVRLLEAAVEAADEQSRRASSEVADVSFFVVVAFF